MSSRDDERLGDDGRRGEGMAMKVLCAFGEHQYGDPSRGTGIEVESFVPAFRHLGHDVIHCETWNRTKFDGLAHLNRNLLETIINEKPDLVFAVPFTNEVWLETIELIREMGIPAACWTTDDSWKYDEQSRFLGKAFPCITTTYADVLRKYERDGIKNVLLTQWAARADALAPPRPANECQYEVSFVGAAHGDRQQRVRELKQLGIEVQCFGHGWPAGSVATDDIPRIMRDSIISLNFANSRGVNQIKARNFEVPGAGGFLLTENAPGLNHWFEVGREFETFDTLAELAEKAKRLLANPQQRDAMATAGFERTKRDHTYDSRMEEVIQFAITHRPTATETNPDKILKRFDAIAQQHSQNIALQLLAGGLTSACQLVWGRDRGPRAARRISHELNWRLFGAHAYSARGFVGRGFPMN